MKALAKNKLVNWILVFISLLLYFYLGYELDRAQFPKLIASTFFLFGTSYFLIKNDQFSIPQLMRIGLIFRILLLFVIPNLSQDFYRFIWDGRMIFNGFNPYLTTPKNLMEQGVFPVPQSQQLFQGMGVLNASHYTNYPPVSQLCYLIAALFGSKSILTSVVIMRLQIILADIGIFYFGKKLLEHLQLPIHSIFWYFLNPFIILELTGNLHFESVMAFFLIWSIYLLFKQQWIFAAIVLGLSVSVKLIPLLFLPLFLGFFLGNKFSISHLLNKSFRVSILNYIFFCGLVLLTTLFTFLPFVSTELIVNFGASIGLWFQNFEFNASIYYIIRWIGFQVVGWNIIGTVGKILPLVVIVLIMVFSLARRNYDKQILLTSMLFGICSYLLLSTTIHPWYLTIPLVLSIYTHYRFLWIWTFTIFFSYHAYRLPEFSEHMGWVTLEYGVVVGYFIYEVFKNKKLGNHPEFSTN